MSSHEPMTFYCGVDGDRNRPVAMENLENFTNNPSISAPISLQEQIPAPSHLLEPASIPTPSQTFTPLTPTHTPISTPLLHPTRGKAPSPSAALLALQRKGLELPSAIKRINTPDSKLSSTSISPQPIPHAHCDNDDSLRVSPLSITSTPSDLRGKSTSRIKPGAGSIGLRNAWQLPTKRPDSTASMETTVSGILNLYINISQYSLKSEYEDETVFTYLDSDSNSDAEYQNEDSCSDDRRIERLQVHQPKAQAYRDTIAPLLEHQFSSPHLEVSMAPSPMSMASVPLLVAPDLDASSSVSSLGLSDEDGELIYAKRTQEELRHRIDGGISPGSIQITPEMSPNISSSDPDASKIADDGGAAQQKEIVLEVPDVRDAESWYDQPLSPVSPDDLEYRNTIRDSQQSGISPQSPDVGGRSSLYFRSLAYESLSPPDQNVKMSPNMKSITIVDVDNEAMQPSQLDLNQVIPSIPNRSTSACQAELVDVDECQHTSVREPEPTATNFNQEIKNDPVEGPMHIYLTAFPSTKVNDATDKRSQLSTEEIQRPGSAFSDSSDSFVIHDTFGGQLKAVLKDTFAMKRKKKNKKPKKKSMETDSKKQNSENVKGKEKGPTMTQNVMTAFSEDLESYKYPYKLSQSSIQLATDVTAIQPAYRIRSPGAIVDVVPETRSSVGSGTRASSHQPSSILFTSGLSVYDKPLPNIQKEDTNNLDGGADATAYAQMVPEPAIPLTRYQKYGEQIWYESNKKKRRQAREQFKKDTEKAEQATRKRSLEERLTPSGEAKDMRKPESGLRLSGPGLDKSQPGFYQQISHAHTTSNGSTVTSKQSTEGNRDMVADLNTKQRISGGVPMSTSSYNNDLFEVSGGKKKSGFASRLMMSSEERRKRKVKESITIVGGGKMNGGSIEMDSLVKFS